jgi:DNA repair protein RadA/Sms
MSRARVVYRCSACGADAPKWAGQCPSCQEWATLGEATAAAAPAGEARGWSGGLAVRFGDVSGADDDAAATGIGELDRALGGGLVPGSVTLLGGEPGIGKSTLLLQLADAVSAQGRRVMYVSAEESAPQLRRRADRLGLALTEVWVQAETSLTAVVDEVRRLEPDLLLVGSIQTVSSPQVASVPGSVTQVRECAQALLELAKAHSMATVLVGHVTKEGTLAGPRTLEHLVDTVLSFEGDRHQGLRFLRAVKHRFGATGEPGVMEMTAEGLVGVADPSGIFLGDRRAGATGSVVVPVVDGHRPLLVELQALVVPTKAVAPRRAAQGIESNRLALLLAVLERRCGVPVLGAEAYVSVVGGVRVAEPGIDLGVVLAVASSMLERPVADDLVVVGEVGRARSVRSARSIVASTRRPGWVSPGRWCRPRHLRAIVASSWCEPAASSRLSHARASVQRSPLLPEGRWQLRRFAQRARISSCWRLVIT